MYKIEKFLLEHKFKLRKAYDNGVIVYTDGEAENEFTTDVILFTKHPIKGKCWEITVYNPYAVTLGSYKSLEEYDKANMIDIHKCLAEDHIDYAFNVKEWLDELENPWEEIE